MALHNQGVVRAVREGKIAGADAVERTGAFAKFLVCLLAASFSVYLSGLVLPIGAQVVNVSSQVSCTDCILVATKEVTIGGPEDQFLTGRPMAVARLANGQFYIRDGGSPLVGKYSSEGRFLRLIGRVGAGPGEFQAPLPYAGRDGRIHILDVALNRHYTLTDQDHVLSVSPMGSGHGVPHSAAAFLSDGSLLINRPLRTAAGAGRPVELLGRDGETIRYFGSAVPFDFRREYLLSRRLYVPPHGREVWVAHAFEYAIEIFDLTGGLVRRVDRAAEFFPKLNPEKPLSSGIGPVPPTVSLIAVWSDRPGSLWTATKVPSRTWTARAAPTPETIKNYPVPPPDSIYSTVIEVIDLPTGRLTVTERFDWNVVGALSDGAVVSYRVDSDGVPYIDIYRIALRRR